MNFLGVLNRAINFTYNFTLQSNAKFINIYDLNLFYNFFILPWCNYFKIRLELK